MWNLSKKYTYPLFESICVLDGKILNKSYHRNRFESAYNKFYWQKTTYDLFDGIHIPPEYQTGKVKLRISYNKDSTKVTFQHYENRHMKTLKLVLDNAIDYDLKFEDRSPLNKLFELRENCDDILIAKNGWITDTSYANIIFFDGVKWVTPSTFLLKGTKRSQLLDSGLIQETRIRVDDLGSYQGFQLINAMLQFDSKLSLPIGQIKF